VDKTFDILIRNGLLYDGSLSDPSISDIGITGDRIAFIGRSGEKGAREIIDARGLAVCPGFIDTHAHSDFTIVADPRAEGKICQGITTEINGNCGMSAAPLYKKAAERREEDLRELGIKERWNGLDEYFAVLGKRGLAMNMAFLAGHGNIRGSVVGYDDKESSPGELQDMAALLREAIGHGAIGLSTGLIYPPGIYSGTEELIRLAGELRNADLIYTSHMRSEGNRLIEAVREVTRIGEAADVKVHISHIKTAGEPNWQKADDVLSLLGEARDRGVKITCDRYPYIASSTDLDSILPSRVFEGGNEEELRRLRDQKERDKIAMQMREQSGSPGYWEKVIVSSVASEKNRWMEGRTIAQISRERGKSGLETVFEVLIEERLRVGAIFLSMKEENLRKFLSLPYCMIGSDSSARSFDGPTKKGKPHPRGFGTFPRLLGQYVRREGLFSLSEAVYKSTQLAAQTFGLRKRGQLKVGFYADVVVFDAGKITDKATFEEPFQKPDGVIYVFVNGVPAVREGLPAGRLSGIVLKRNTD
jgi:N-acyl-D-amino-acid deacylase